MLPRKGKAPCTAAPSDDEDAATAPISGREAQSRAGVLRQLRPDAQDQRVAASKAAAAKRSAGAMPKEERQAKRAKHMKEGDASLIRIPVRVLVPNQLLPVVFLAITSEQRQQLSYEQVKGGASHASSWSR